MRLLDAGLPSPVRGVFTTRAGGTSAAPFAAANLSLRTGDDPPRVAQNRRLLTAGIGLPGVGVTFAEQVHGAGVAVVDAPPGPGQDALPGVDALVTARPGLPLGVLGADCLPVLLADPQAGVVAAAHAGREGLVAGVLQATLAAMAGLGAAAARTTAVLGPAIGGCCYELPAATASRVGAAVPGAAARTSWGTPSVDLRAGAVALLEVAGVARVRHVGGCTYEQPAFFFSYRRDGCTGRHAGVVVLA